jgi:hypothetical protein
VQPYVARASPEPTRCKQRAEQLRAAGQPNARAAESGGDPSKTSSCRRLCKSRRDAAHCTRPRRRCALHTPTGTGFHLSRFHRLRERFLSPCAGGTTGSSAAGSSAADTPRAATAGEGQRLWWANLLPTLQQGGSAPPSAWGERVHTTFRQCPPARSNPPAPRAAPEATCCSLWAGSGGRGR